MEIPVICSVKNCNNPTSSGFKMCDKCRAYHRAWNLPRSKERKAKLEAVGACIKCGLPKEVNQFKMCGTCRKEKNEYYATNREKESAGARRRNQALKLEVLQHYSNLNPYCACCGETAIEFLAIDHKNGNGNEHRRKIGNKGGIHMYYWLRNNNFPEGYRVLCMNCNFAYSAYGICPHQERGKQPSKS
jgi:hypothetical protein